MEGAAKRRLEETITQMERDLDEQRHAAAVAQQSVSRLEVEVANTRHQMMLAKEGKSHAEELHAALMERFQQLEAVNATLKTRYLFSFSLCVVFSLTSILSP